MLTAAEPRGRAVALLPLAVMMLAGCAGSIGLEEEAELGSAYARQILQEVPLVRDQVAAEMLNRLGRELAAQADSTGREYHFYLVDSPEVNAFAVPGGHIFVNRGLIQGADQVSELAGVLGHEIAHVTERHGLEQVEKRQRAGMLVTLVYWLMDRQPGVLERVAIEGGGAALFAKYGRDAEREADQFAVQTVAAAGYDPDGVATFFEALLLERTRDPTRFDQWFASHPTSEERVRATRVLIQQMGDLEGRGLKDDTEEYQRFRSRVIGPATAPDARGW